MVQLKKYKDLYDKKIFKVGTNSASEVFVGGIKLSVEEQEKLLRSLGWDSIRGNTYECLKKTEEFIEAVGKNIKEERYINATTVVIESKPGKEYDKYIYRFVLETVDGRVITIVEGVTGAGAKVCLYKNRSTIAAVRGRNIGQVLKEEFSNR